MSDEGVRTGAQADWLGMTEEQWARFQAWTRGFGDQDANGVDLSLLRESLRRTPTERLRKLHHFRASEARAPMADHDEEFQLLLTTLERRKVRFVLIGGVAMRAHGSRHVTDDLDLYYARDRQNLAAIADALTPLHPRLRGIPEGLPFRWDVHMLRSSANLTLATDAGDFDLLSDITGVDSFQGLWERSVEMELFGVPVRVASLEDLIRMKRAANRPKDQTHLFELEALRRLQRGETTNGEPDDPAP
jgi:predicted nucleotidyltransferase